MTPHLYSQLGYRTHLGHRSYRQVCGFLQGHAAALRKRTRASSGVIAARTAGESIVPRET
jgi:hypothetical protein